MKLLLDENLSRRLLNSIGRVFPGSVHVSQVGLTSGTPDRRIWEYAQQNGFTIMMADSDFVTLSNTLGRPPKSYSPRKPRLPDGARGAADFGQRFASA